jgi:raffinose/stachyose/melibiose transport system substrate-binding protein
LNKFNWLYIGHNSKEDKKMKKIVVVVLILTILSVVLYAGGGKEQGAQNAGGQLVLTSTSWRNDDLAYWNKINTKFHEIYPNITVQFEPVYSTEYDSVLMTSLKSGRAADIIYLRSWDPGRQIYDAGYVKELTTQDIPNLANLPDSAHMVWQNNAGVSYGVPGSMIYGGFFYNKGIFAKCGVTPPKTWNEFLNVCRTIAAAGTTPVAFGIKDSWMVAEYLSGNILPATSGGSKWHARLMNKEVNFTDPAFVKHLDWIKQLAQYFPRGYEGIGFEDMRQLFLSGQAAIYPVGSWEMGYLQETNPALDLGFFFMPGETANAQLSINFNCVDGWAINASIDPAKLDAAKTYLNWLASTEGGQLLSNEIVGFYSVNPSATTLQNALSAECAKTAATGDLFQQIPYQKLSDNSPDYTTAISEAVYKLLVGGATPQEAAQAMQISMAWYFK